MKNIKDKIMSKTQIRKILKMHYGSADPLAVHDILCLMGENELGDSGVTGEHGDLHDVANRSTHGLESKTPVERPLPHIPDTERLGFYCESNSQGINCHKQCYWCKQEEDV